MIDKYLTLLISCILISITSCTAEYDLLEEINEENLKEDSSTSTCVPINNTVIHEGSRIVYDDVYYTRFTFYLTSGRSLKGEDNQIGSQLEMEFSGPLSEGFYTVADHTITGSIAGDEVVLSGSFPINGTKYVFFAEVGSNIIVELTRSGKWSASFCDVKFTVDYPSLTDNFVTNGNLIQSIP